jgi:hypothetical protein
MADDLEIKVEIEDATADLRDALHELNGRVEDKVAQLRPDRGIRKHPVATVCVAGALGFALGSDFREVALIGLFGLGAAIMLSRSKEVGDPNELGEPYENEAGQV